MSGSTNVWTANGDGTSYTDPNNWSLTIEPGPGQFAVIAGGVPELTDAEINGYTLDLFSQDTLTSSLALGGATLGPSMVVEDTNSTSGQTLLIAGQTTNDGTILLNATVPGEINGATFDFSDTSSTLTNNGVITIGANDGLFVGNGDGGVLVNDGVINVAATRMFYNSPIAGDGTINIDDTTLEVGGSIDVTQTLAFTDNNSAILFDSGRLGLDVGGSEGTVDNFFTGDTLEFSDLNFTLDGSGFNDSTRILTVVTNNGTLEIHLGGTADYTSTFTEAQAGDGFAVVTSVVACFAAGTRIRTAHGDVAVEQLQPGDAVALHGGGTAPVRWVGHRRVECARHPRPWDVRPVRVAADAFGPGLPAHDLLLSPDHALFLAGTLIPVRYLVNGATVAQIDADAVTYYHVELPRHAVLFAEGLPAESYLDTGNRAAFAEGGDTVQLHPDFARRIWDADGCAPLVCEGPPVSAARRHLLARAFALGYALTDAADIRVMADARAVPARRSGSVLHLRLPESTRGLRLLSRAGVPAHLDADSADHRRLGVAVTRLVLDGADIALTDARLGAGWHAQEHTGEGAGWRWTDGDAVLAIDGRHRLDIEIAMTQPSWRAPPAPPHRRRA